MKRSLKEFILKMTEKLNEEKILSFQQFEGSDDYIASQELQEAVNVALLLQKPLLLKGEPGTGKTLLAEAVAHALNRPLFTWHVKSTSKAQEGLYTYDALQRLYDSRFNDKNVSDLKQYIKYGGLGQAFLCEQPSVVLIDEIDKADIDFPNDLLHELDAMTMSIYETGETFEAKHRPLIIITSNNEKELPDAFLRRCVFHFIAFPDVQQMLKIVKVHHPKIEDLLLDQLLSKFYALRNIPQLRKLPSTSELIDWIGVLIKAGVDPQKLVQKLPFLGTLLKKEQDLQLVEQIMRKKSDLR